MRMWQSQLALLTSKMDISRLNLHTFAVFFRELVVV